QYEALRTLVDLGSPLIVALNKMDRYAECELELVRNRLAERVGERLEIAPVQCGGMEEVTRIYHDGREETALRERPAQIDELRRACNAISTAIRKCWTRYAIPPYLYWRNKSWIARSPSTAAKEPTPLCKAIRARRYLARWPRSAPALTC
ncbi:MAG: hypothetical protein HC889_16210, partial [Synechococcaceae cyanobacterium SM1_2_3]|nr:hypothetical protein [Synechococcaceae cyanobacterium SM1_2_3]